MSQPTDLREYSHRRSRPPDVGGQVTTTGQPVDFRRQLDDQVTIEVIDVCTDLEPGIVAGPGRRSAGRVVLTMPDFVADTLSHVIRNVHAVAALLTWSSADDVDADAPGLDLARALYEASRVHGYQCVRHELHDLPGTSN